MKLWVLALLGSCLLVSLPHGCVSDESAHSFREGAETLPFQAEVNRLMDIIIHSLYSNKDIYIRELISNAADALDKVRFLSLTDKSALGQGAAADLPLEIKLSIDKDKKMISLRDTGVGMTREDLVNNLGTIAKSGTAAFLEQMQKGGDLNLIGQFGVGFYSVYLVADYVELVTKHAQDKQYIWESKASGIFAISEDTTGEDLGRGTQINIYLKDSCLEYLEEAKLRELVQRYSEFISFPIKLLVTKQIEKEVPVEEEQIEKADTSAEGVEVADEEEEGEKKPKTMTVTETVQEWEILNDSKALWLRPPGNVSEAEYDKFYKALVKSESETSLTHSHFRAEGDVDFKAVLYIPGTAPADMYDNYYTKKPRMKLYVRRVFISESFEELLPRWLSFLVGLVDSDTMPLNVSREMLQLHEGLKVIKKKLVRKALDMMKKLSDAEVKAQELAGKDGEEEGNKKGWFGLGGDGGPTEEEKKQIEEEGKKYDTLWKQFGKAIKMGVIEDASNRRRLMPLLRFATSASKGNLTSLDGYISRMKQGQKNIYYLVGGSVEEVESSPFVETLVERGFEVIYFTDPLDEYMMGNVNEYEEKTFANVSKEDLKLDEDRSDDEKTRDKRAEAYFSGLTKWWKDAIASPTIMAVKVSRRLTSTPCVVVSGKYGWTATMERIARAQALGDADKAAFMRGQRTLEINPKHPLVKELRAKWEVDESSTELKESAKLLYDTCLMESGFLIDDVKSFNQRVLGLLKKDLNVDGDAAPAEDEYPPTPEELAKEKAAEEAKQREAEKAAAAAESVAKEEEAKEKETKDEL